MWCADDLLRPLSRWVQLRGFVVPLMVALVRKGTDQEEWAGESKGFPATTSVV